MISNNLTSSNKLLNHLSLSEYQQIAPYFQEVTLKAGQILYDPYDPITFAYFPLTAMISLVSIMENGATTEIGLIGNEGMIGLPIFLGGEYTTSQVIVQIAGTSLKIKAQILKQEFAKGGTLQKILLLYTQARLTQIAQSATCNRQHKIEARLARWLLSVYDSVLIDELPLTQEFISNMLGVRRAGVTIAANGLQKKSIISYNRGKIVILDHEKLKETSCECYRVVEEEFIRLIGARRG
ncbi:cAMP-binding proteins - catabolite gene activator and regulatory subunit of cAMP-dependent protein kinases [Geminocystis sp. NIES-3708]|uniref:Crp/Fnr family transcriptional regulator n=1 Tax=Geminocystis sp. NIES-3708 TaxID=1615909 RepID=UPI0005FCAAAD|nr:Crp/Fnr family transcriptional regulator [Geminocystis sp. NIES-3708]BAQ62993.1 cAMP-binding proteins - catabolite gene activator and regulatory subunit of cAMP-dependent protein kinases [Geminocystis sp. NIES-3708]